MTRIHTGEKNKSFCFFAVGDRRGRHESPRRNLRPQTAVASRHEIPRALQLALEFATSSLSFFARRRSAARRSNHRANRLGRSLGADPCGDTLPKACKVLATSTATFRARIRTPSSFSATASAARSSPASPMAPAARSTAKSVHPSPAKRFSSTPHSYLESNNLADMQMEDALLWCDEVRKRITSQAEERGCTTREFATTLLTAILSPDLSVFFQIGDGGIILGNDVLYGVVFWPQEGEYANSTNFLTGDQYHEQIEFITTTSRSQKSPSSAMASNASPSASIPKSRTSHFSIPCSAYCKPRTI